VKYIVMVALLFASSVVLAQSNQPASSNNPNAPSGFQGGQQRFEEMKARHLEHISRRIAKLQQIQACVQAAANPEALRACRPQHQAQ